MKKILATLATASTIVAGSALYAPSAQAIKITLDETDYKISTIEGTFLELQTVLEDQPWFGLNSLSNPGRASEAAEQVKFELGNLNPDPGEGAGGPFFVRNRQVSREGIPINALGVLWVENRLQEEEVFDLDCFCFRTEVTELGTGVSGRGYDANETLVFAIATEVESHDVPEPLTILGTITFGGFIAGMKKRRSQQN